MNWVVGPVDAGDLLVKEDRKGRALAAGLSDMVGVVEPDREELRRMQDRRFELDLTECDAVFARGRRSSRAIQRAGSYRQQSRHLARQLRHGRSKIDHRVFDHHANAGASLMCEGCELHRLLPLRAVGRAPGRSGRARALVVATIDSVKWPLSVKWSLAVK